MIHLGDIYYAGTKPECEAVLKMWPLCDADGAPIKDRSFALNGNHEMFCVILPPQNVSLSKWLF